MLRAEIDQVHEIAKNITEAGLSSAMTVVLAKIADMQQQLTQLKSTVDKIGAKKKTEE